MDEKQKLAIYSWRGRNKERYNELQREYNKTYRNTCEDYSERNCASVKKHYENNKERILLYKKEYYKKKKEEKQNNQIQII